MLTTYVCLLVKSTGKPDAGNPHVRFDEGEGISLPTLPDKNKRVHIFQCKLKRIQAENSIFKQNNANTHRKKSSKINLIIRYLDNEMRILHKFMCII